MYIELLEKRIPKFFDKTAVCYQDKCITYRELRNSTDDFASLLLERGLNKGDFVAVVLLNGLDLIPAILAVWKAGGVFVPIDPNYPKIRIESMLEDAKPKFLITNSDSLKELDVDFDGQTVLIDTISLNSGKVIFSAIASQDLAYVIYTSGTTGKPKGILVEHSSLQHAAIAFKDLHPECSVSLVCGSISFDPSLLSIVYSLLQGATLCLHENRNGIDDICPKDVVDIIQSHHVDFMLTTPSFYRKVLQEKESLFSLKNVDLCGETVQKDMILSHAKFAPKANLFNAYGPSEYAIGATAGKLYDPGSGQITEKISVGKPFGGNKVYLIDDNLEIVPLGTKGEILVGGPGLSRGYLNLDELTKEKFIWIEDKNRRTRVYRTGDYGYCLSNHDIVYCGRVDSQVKVNGHRVEISEVESTINNCPFIEKSVVALVHWDDNEPALVAFYSYKDSGDDESLEEHLKDTLPSYMLPKVCIKISRWPLTANGKIDKRLLVQEHCP